MTEDWPFASGVLPYPMNEGEVRQAREWCAEAEAVVITAGAGMGVDSGLPDFRGNEGFWKAYPPYERLGFSFMEMASPSRFSDAPELGWGFYGHRLDLYRRTTPHEGFRLLREYAASRPLGYGVFTSNVDGHFHDSGFDARHIVECHGSIRHFQCFQECSAAIWEAGEAEVIVDPETMRAQPPLPACPQCGGLARPNILMFGDWHWIARRTSAQEARLRKWLSALGAERMVILEFGAGTAISTVRHFSETLAKQHKAPLVRVNPRESQRPPGVDGVSLPLGALEAIERLML